MKKNLTNREIEKCLSVLNSPDSFRGKIGVDIPGNMDWSIRVNIKALSEIYSLFSSARDELAKRYVDAGKTDGDKLLPEFAEEYSREYTELITQDNEISLRALNIKQIFSLEGISPIERDVLMMMCSDEDVDNFFSINDDDEVSE